MISINTTLYIKSDVYCSFARVFLSFIFTCLFCFLLYKEYNRIITFDYIPRAIRGEKYYCKSSGEEKFKNIGVVARGGKYGGNEHPYFMIIILSYLIVFFLYLFILACKNLILEKIKGYRCYADNKGIFFYDNKKIAWTDIYSIEFKEDENSIVIILKNYLENDSKTIILNSIRGSPQDLVVELCNMRKYFLKNNKRNVL